MSEERAANVYWNSKKGQYWIKKEVETEQGLKEMPVGPVSTHGPRPTNLEVMQRYVAYLNHALVGTQKLKDEGVVQADDGDDYIDQVISAEHYNIKKFISEELGHHYNSFQVKAILLKAKKEIEKADREGAYQFLTMRTGPRGAGLKKSTAGASLAAIYSKAVLHKPALDERTPEAVVDQPESVIAELAKESGMTPKQVVDTLAKSMGATVNVVSDK